MLGPPQETRWQGIRLQEYIEQARSILEQELATMPINRIEISAETK